MKLVAYAVIARVQGIVETSTNRGVGVLIGNGKKAPSNQNLTALSTSYADVLSTSSVEARSINFADVLSTSSVEDLRNNDAGALSNNCVEALNS